MPRGILDFPGGAVTLGPEPIQYPLGVEQGAVYTLIANGQRAVIGDPSDRDFVGYLTESPSGLERAQVRESADDLPEGDGGLHGDFFYGRLPFTLTGLLYPDAGASVLRQDKLLRATDAMIGDGELRWTPSAPTPPVVVFFRQQNPTRITGRRPKAFLVAGVAEDPLVYSQEIHFAQTADLLTVSNIGRKPSWPLVTLYGPFTSAVGRNLSTGGYLLVNYACPSGGWVAIDTNPRRRTVRLNDGTNLYDKLDRPSRVWWPISPGGNDLDFDFTGGGANTQATVQHRDAWG